MLHPNVPRRMRTKVAIETVFHPQLQSANSFIIKNADESFETNSKLIPKLKHHKTMVAHETPKYTSFVEGNRPTPRDGHSAVVDSLGFMYVFGGDRHHMPFNDLYMIRLE
jgi:hypothetical protein